MKTNLQFLPLLYLVLLFSSSLTAQVTFSNANHLLNPENRNSGTAMGIADMNGDGLDDILHLFLAKTLFFDYQNPQGERMLSKQITSKFDKNQWMLTVGDVDNNGFNDMMMGGYYDDIKVYYADALGQNYSFNKYPGGQIFAQGANYVDLNKDGLLDAFVCHDEGTNRLWEGNGDGTFKEADQWIDLRIPGSTDNAGNYGSIWTDINLDGELDLYIAKCKDKTAPTDDQRINVLYVNVGTPIQYMEQGEANRLNSNRQSWSSDFQDIDNDGDFDCFLTNHDDKSDLTHDKHQLFENDGTGKFTDITESSGIDSTAYAFQALFRDFDNDGWVDLLVAGREAAYFHNNGDPERTGQVTFTRREISLPGSQHFQSCTVGDLNHDGFLDVYTSYFTGKPNIDLNVDPESDSLWLNQGNDNHFLAVKLEGVMSNRNAVGARIVIYVDGIMQTREVRAGESYGIQTTFNQYFGLKDATLVDSLRVWWPSGMTEVFKNIPADQFLYIKEKTCVSPPSYLDLSGSLILCAGDTLTISAPPGFDYLWSTGEMGASIQVTEAGSYNVTVSDGSACPGISKNITVQYEPDETPTIEALGSLVTCPNEQVTLRSSVAQNYLWSTGETTPQIEVMGGGQYWVEVAGYCQNFSSDSINLEVFDLSVKGFGDTILTVGRGVLRGEGDSLRWYDQKDGGELLATGPEFETPTVEEDTEYWLEGINVFPAPSFYGGKKNISEQGSFGNLGKSGLTFKLERPVFLKSFKVYANSSGMRNITFKHGNGNLEKIELEIPEEGEVRVEVGVVLSACEECEVFVTDNDIDLFSEDDNAEIEFPYPLDNFGAITGSINNAYDFFYDWEFSDLDSVVCVSERIPVLLDLRDDNDIPNPSGTILIFPNPNTGLFSIKKETRDSAEIFITDVGGKLMYEKKLEPSSLHEFDLSFFANGMYVIRLIVDDQTFISKILIQR